MPWYTIGLLSDNNKSDTEQLPELNFNDPGYFATTQNGKLLFSSEEMDRWKECNIPNDCLAYQIFSMDNEKLLLLSKSGDVYYSYTGENWVLALSTGVEISDDIVPDRHFAFYDKFYMDSGKKYCFLCVEDHSLYKTIDGINWDKVTWTGYSAGWSVGISIRTINKRMFKFKGNNIGVSSDYSLYSSEGLKNWSSGYFRDVIISDVGSLDNNYAYIPVYNSKIYYKAALHSSTNIIANAEITTNTCDFSRVVCSNTSNSLIIGLKSTPYIWYYLDPTDKTKFIKVEISSEVANSSGYFYDEHKDRYIAQFSNHWCYINANNVSSECTILDNVTFPDSDTVVSSFIYKSNNNTTQ